MPARHRQPRAGLLHVRAHAEEDAEEGAATGQGILGLQRLSKLQREFSRLAGINRDYFRLILNHLDYLVIWTISYKFAVVFVDLRIFAVIV